MELVTRAMAVGLAAALAACGGGGGGTGPTVTVEASAANNLRPTSVSVATPAADVQVGHALQAEVRIEAVEDTRHVQVAFHAVPRADWEAQASGSESEVLGVALYDLVLAGEHAYTAALTLPATMAAGAYYVVAEVDPREEIPERDETDQRVASLLTIADDRKDRPLVVVESAVVDVPTFELAWPTDDSVPEPVGLTAVIRVEGASPLVGAALRIAIEGAGLACPPVAAGCPVRAWDTATQTYQDTLPLPDLVPGDSTTVHADLFFSRQVLDAFEKVMLDVGKQCLDTPSVCIDQYAACAQGCFAETDLRGLGACFLRCLPFRLRVTVEKDGVVPFDGSGAGPLRDLEVEVNVLPPVPPAEASSGPRMTVEPALLAVDPAADQPMLGHPFRARLSGCSAEIQWTLSPLDPPGATAIGELAASAGTFNGYRAPPGTGLDCNVPSPPLTTKAVLTASGCGASGAAVIALRACSPALSVGPRAASVTAGDDAPLRLDAVLTDCALGPGDRVQWALDAGALADGGRLTPAPDGWSATYQPPRKVATASQEVLVTASAASCTVSGSALVTVQRPTELRFEKSYVKRFGNPLFGAGIDVYAGAILDQQGGRALSHATVPASVLGLSLDVVGLQGRAEVDPVTRANSYFSYGVEAFGLSIYEQRETDGYEGSVSVDALTWSKCLPDEDPGVCVAQVDAQRCTTSTGCPKDYPKCWEGTCTKECNDGGDCSGLIQICKKPSFLKPSKSKKVFFVVGVPVTVEARICENVGLAHIDVKLLPPPDHDAFMVDVGPFGEIVATASAALGYTGLLAAGVEGELTLLREEVFKTLSAQVLYHDAADPTSPCAGERCIEGSLTTGLGASITGLGGKVDLFLDYPKVKWCTWHPCVGIDRARHTLFKGALWERVSACKFPLLRTAVPCATDGDCHRCQGGVCEFSREWDLPDPVACTGAGDCAALAVCADGWCADAWPGWQCRERDGVVMLP